MNVVGKALPFHMICDCGTKALPFTISRTDAASPGMAPGESEVIWGCGTEPSQLLKSTIALQVVHPASSRVRAAMKAMRTNGKGLRGLTRQERIPASQLRALPIVTFGARSCALPSNDNPWLTSAATPNPELLWPQATAELRSGWTAGRPSPHVPNPPFPTSRWQVAWPTSAANSQREFSPALRAGCKVRDSK